MFAGLFFRLTCGNSSLDFTLGPNEGEEFPQVSLKNNPANMLNFLRYYTYSDIDFVNNFVRFVDFLSSSYRFFNMLAVVVLTSLVVLSFLLFFMRTHIAFTHTPDYFLHHLNRLLRRHRQEYAFGIVSDEQGNRLSRVRIEIIDAQSKQSLTHLNTNKAGSFHFRNTFGTDAVQVILTKEGYAPYTDTIILNCGPEGCALIRFTLKKSEAHNVAQTFWKVLEHLLGLSFEFILLSSFILEFFFFSLFGFTKTLPFFLISSFNVILWIFFLKEKREK